MPIEKLELLRGGVAIDPRGSLRYCNPLIMSEFVRFYTIENSAVGFVRGWHGHKFEQKAIFPIKGKIRVGAALVSDWNYPGESTVVERFELDSNDPRVLLIPGGYANAIVSLTPGAIAGVFSTSTLQDSLRDDYRFPSDAWTL